MVCGGALLAALAAHEYLFHVYGILLPLDRTAMWVVVLFLAMAAMLAAEPLRTIAGRLSGYALTAILLLIAVYNLGCLRLTYFNEWKYDADMKNVYRVLAFYNHRYGVTRVSVNWRYVAALNCYRVMSGQETLEQIPGAPSELGSYPPGYQAYVSSIRQTRISIRSRVSSWCTTIALPMPPWAFVRKWKTGHPPPRPSNPPKCGAAWPPPTVK